MPRSTTRRFIVAAALGMPLAMTELARASTRLERGATMLDDRPAATNATAGFGPLTGPAAAGPLVVSRTNPRSFAAASAEGDERVIYLTGSHDGRKVIISDADHYAPGGGDALWAWKSFLRGHNPILMDHGIIDVVNSLDPSLGVPSFASFEPARYAMGNTRRRVPHPATERDGRAIHGDAAGRRVRGRVVRHRQPREARRGHDVRGARGEGQLHASLCNGRSDGNGSAGGAGSRGAFGKQCAVTESDRRSSERWQNEHR